MHAREEKLKLEASIPRKLNDSWEPVIKMKLSEFECNPSCPIVLGRPFLRTVGAVIDTKEGNINFNSPSRNVWNTSL